MKAYEMTFIIRPDLDEDDTRGVMDQVASRVQTAGGEILAVVPWNPPRRRMAYPIQDFGDGFYVTTVFRIEPPGLPPIETALKLNERVLRYLLIQATETNIQQAQQRVQQQQAAAAAPRPQPAAESGDAEPAEIQAAGEPAPEAGAETEAVLAQITEESAPEPEAAPVPAAEAVPEPVAEVVPEPVADVAEPAAEPEAAAPNASTTESEDTEERPEEPAGTVVETVPAPVEAVTNPAEANPAPAEEPAGVASQAPATEEE
ncbi:MAG: 30S ribosomal protein S6 [Chloroflexota bacterium]